LAYTELNQKIPLDNQDKISLYWLTNETQEIASQKNNETQNQTPIPLQK
jgi:hypothetical protein